MDDNCSSKRKNRDDFRRPFYNIKQGLHTSGFRGALPSILTKRKKKKVKKKDNKKASTVQYLGDVSHPGYFLYMKVKVTALLW